MNEVLSQDEINTLLKGLSEGEIEEGRGDCSLRTVGGMREGGRERASERARERAREGARERGEE